MRADNELVLDIIYKRKKELQLYINELEVSFDDASKDNLMYYESDISLKKDEIVFLNEIIVEIERDSEGLKYLKGLLKYYSSMSISNKYIDISKYSIVKQLIKEYKINYKKNYWYNRQLGLKGVFDNDLFCKLIKDKIDKYTNCNKVTKNKYRHLVAFLNELLVEMEDSSNPLKTLKDKLKMYDKHKKLEVIKIKTNTINKSVIIRNILKEYSENKNKAIKC